MPAVDFVFAADCPNVAQARANLERALHAAGLPPRWLEWDVGDAATPAEFHRYGSPTILVNGRDIDAPDAPVEAGAAGNCVAGSCRVYEAADGLGGVPPVERIVEALRRAMPAVPAAPPERLRWRGLAVLPSLGLAAVPVGLCPVCIAGHLAVFGALGMGFLLDPRVLLPLSVLALLVALAPLAWKARARRGFGPLALGSLGALSFGAGQFVLASPVAVWLGATALVGATLWNAWPSSACDACLPQPHLQREPA